ncbi:hypothetical protein ABPG74_006375 [Tetrahymena malaccensis]
MNQGQGSIPQKYRHQVRIGNWSEEWELEKIRFKDYLATQTKTSIAQQKIEAGHQKASLTYSKDGYIHFGDRIMLYNDKTRGYLVCDIWEKYNQIDESYPVSTTGKTFPCARSIFLIQPCPEDYNPRQNILCYGQKFKIVVNPRMFRKPLYLSSQPADPQRSKKNSRQQDSFLSSKDNFDSVWVVEHIDPQIRFEMNKQPVRANDPIILKHFQTNQYLASDEQQVKNSYGIENEVFALQYQTYNKTQNLIAEKMGRTTIDIPMRNQHSQNTWCLVTADDPILEFDESVLDRIETPKDIVQKLRYQISARGFFSLRGLDFIFRDMDQQKTGQLEYDDFRWGLRNFGIQSTPEEVKLLMEAYDKNLNGYVDYQEFISSLRGSLSDRRSDLVSKAYEKVQQQYGVVNLESIGKAYKAHKYTDVLRGQKTAKQHFDEFIKEWQIKDLLKPISKLEFILFYQDVSALIDREEQFDSLIKQTWEL